MENTKEMKNCSAGIRNKMEISVEIEKPKKANDEGVRFDIIWLDRNSDVGVVQTTIKHERNEKEN